MRPVWFGLHLLLIAFASNAQLPALPNETLIEQAATVTMKVDGYPDFLAVDNDGVWVTNTERVEKFVFGSTQPVMSVAMPAPCGAMATGFGSLWVVSCSKKSLYRIDLLSGAIVAIIETGVADPYGELSVAIGAGSVWLLTNTEGELSRIDPYRNSVARRIKVAPHSFAAAFGFNSVWITNTENNSVQRIDPAKEKVVATISVGVTPRFLAAGTNAVWILNQGDGSVSRIDPESNVVKGSVQTEVKGTGGDIAAGANKIYVRANNTLLSVIDATSNHILARYGPRAGSGAVRVENGRVWVTAHDTNTIWILNE